MERAYFFDDGLQFSCTECGACCTGDPGTIFINKEEVAALAAHLGREIEDLIENDLYPLDSAYSIKERANGDCWYLVDKRCSIHEFRPTQCRTYPFWLSTLRSEKAWETACNDCPGIGQGKRWSKEEILSELDKDMQREG